MHVRGKHMLLHGTNIRTHAFTLVHQLIRACVSAHASMLCAPTAVQVTRVALLELAGHVVVAKGGLAHTCLEGLASALTPPPAPPVAEEPGVAGGSWHPDPVHAQVQDQVVAALERVRLNLVQLRCLGVKFCARHAVDGAALVIPSVCILCTLRLGLNDMN